MVHTTKSLLDDIIAYTNKYDKKPQYKDLKTNDPNVASIQTYVRRFGSFRQAVIQAINHGFKKSLLEFDDEDVDPTYYTVEQPLTIAQEVICDTLDLDVYPANFGYTGWSEDYGAVKVLEAEQDADGKYIYDLTGDYEPDTFVLVGWSKYDHLNNNPLMKFVLIVDSACLVAQSYIKVTDADSRHWKRCSIPVGPFNKNLFTRRYYGNTDNN